MLLSLVLSKPLGAHFAKLSENSSQNVQNVTILPPKCSPNGGPSSKFIGNKSDIEAEGRISCIFWIDTGRNLIFDCVCVLSERWVVDE